MSNAQNLAAWINKAGFPLEVNKDSFDPGTQENFLTRVPLGRWGGQDDLKGAIVYLASRASDYVTGTNLVVDGGYLACGIGDSYAPWARPAE